MALPLIAIITVFCAIGVALALDAVQGRSVTEFLQITEELRAGCVTKTDLLLITVLIPLLLEAIFRGYIFSFFEKIHFIVAIVLSTALYSAAAYYCYASYAQRSMGSTSSAAAAALIALFLGFVFSVMTWRLRSCIPAILGHIFIANSAPLTEAVRASGYIKLPLAIIVLAVSLALLVFLPVLFAKRMPVFAADYPFTNHHKRMYKWLEGKKKSRRSKAAREGTDSEPKKAKAEGRDGSLSLKDKAKDFEKKAGGAVKKTVHSAEEKVGKALHKSDSSGSGKSTKGGSQKNAKSSSGKSKSGSGKGGSGKSVKNGKGGRKS